MEAVVWNHGVLIFLIFSNNCYLYLSWFHLTNVFISKLFLFQMISEFSKLSPDLGHHYYYQVKKQCSCQDKEFKMKQIKCMKKHNIISTTNIYSEIICQTQCFLSSYFIYYFVYVFILCILDKLDIKNRCTYIYFKMFVNQSCKLKHTIINQQKFFLSTSFWNIWLFCLYFM